MRRRACHLPLVLALALPLAACAGPPPVPSDLPVSATPTAGGGLGLDDVRRVLREGLEQVPLDDLIARAHRTLVEEGAATLRVPHEGHVHHYVLVWVSGARTLLFFERTGDGVERLVTRPVS